MQGERVSAAVPASADSWTDVGTFTVPAKVQRLSKLDLSLAPDWGTTAVSVRFAPVFRIIGSGVQEQSPHEYVGRFGGVSVVTTGGISHDDVHEEYDLDIPVQTGGTFTVQVNTLDEAVTAGTVEANAAYDNEAPTQKNQMSQYIDAAGTTTAGAYASVGTITIAKPKEGSAPTMISELVMGVAPDQGTSAISLRTASVFRLTGSGIDEAGLHDFTGPYAYDGHIGTTPSQGTAHSKMTKRIKNINIPIVAGGTITVEHQFITETPTASTVAVGVVYK